MSSKQFHTELAKCSTLSPEEQKELFIKYKEEGCQKAYSKLIESNLKLVIHLSKTYHTLNRQDLIQEGNIGLIKAIQKFNPYINIMFSTYASFWIKKHFNEFIITDNTIKIPQNIYYQMKKEDAMIKKLIDDFEDIFENLESDEQPEDNEQIEMILLAARHITDEEFLVLSKYFGIGGTKQTMVQIGKEIGKKRQRVYQIKESALDKIRKVLKIK